MEQPKAYTVTAITRIIKSTLESSLQGIWVEGEVTGYLHHSSGHRYFSLKDDNAVIRGVIWRSIGSAMKFELQNGQKVLAFGDINVYEKGGQYQINCRKVIPVGVGPLELAYRQLKEKLAAEGLFDPSRRKPIPAYARRIGIVTSPTGAAIRDIVQIARRRNRAVALVLYAAAVQGDGAEETIAAGIRYFNSRDDIDVIIVGRGGGSLEDLWPFNTEVAVRAIAGSRIPIISAVGHEIDFTLSDFAADLRAPTPSAASELAVWPLAETREQIERAVGRQGTILLKSIREGQARLEALRTRPVLARPMDLVRQRQQHLDQLCRLLVGAGKNNFEKHRNRLSLVLSRMEALSPLRILSRGYTVSRRLPSGAVIGSIADVKPGELMETLVADGRVVSSVEEVKAEQHGGQEEV